MTSTIDILNDKARFAAVLARAPKRSYACVACRDSGWTVRKDDRGWYSYTRRCKCQEAAIIAGQLAAASVPECLVNNTLATWPRTDDERAILQRFRAHIARATLFGPGALVLGPVGTGKTGLLVGALKDLLHRTIASGGFARYADANRLIDRSRGMLDFGSTERIEAELVHPCVDAYVLALDEVGRRADRDAHGVVSRIIRDRHASGRLTIIASNCTRGDLSVVGSDIESRIVEMCGGESGIFTLTGPDRRKFRE